MIELRFVSNNQFKQKEAKAILAEALRGKRPDDWAPVDAIYQRLASSGRTFTDSAELLREDRDR